MNDVLPGCIMFDLDGTLLDSLPGIEHSVRAAYLSCHLPPPEMSLRSLIGPPIRTILAQLTNMADRRALTALESAFRANYDHEGWQMTVCYPDATRVLQTMHEHGYRLFVISNKPRRISLQILRTEGISDLFEAILTRDSRLPQYSGKVEMLTALMKEHLASPENYLFTGDTMEDAEAAAAVGIRFAFMTHGYGEIPETSHVVTHFRFDGFRQFLPLIAMERVG